jgi:hypothetical protein
MRAFAISIMSVTTAVVIVTSAAHAQETSYPPALAAAIKLCVANGQVYFFGGKTCVRQCPAGWTRNVNVCSCNTPKTQKGKLCV